MKLASTAAVWLAIAFAAAAAEPAGDADTGFVQALRGGGHVIVFRHGATHQAQPDTDPLNLDNTARQRHLNDQGRLLARQIGEAFKTLGIPVGEVYTSAFQRAYDTGHLAFGKATKVIDLAEGGLVVTPIENNRRAAAFRKLVATPPASGTNTVLVSHKPNIIDALGKDWFEVKEGEASVFKVEPGGTFVLVRRLPADEWARLARKMAP